MSANKPKQQETGRKPGQQEKNQSDRQDSGQRGEWRDDQYTEDKNKKKKGGDFEDR
ncbi:MAG TPA: hypothetical protein VNS63_20035 [Blastocatellia bacterium]|nr:hypothetical protein [Blastocatellia bacterium]